MIIKTYICDDCKKEKKRNEIEFKVKLLSSRNLSFDDLKYSHLAYDSKELCYDCLTKRLNKIAEYEKELDNGK